MPATKTEGEKHIDKMVRYYTDKPERLGTLFRVTRNQFKQIVDDVVFYKRLLYVVIFLNFIYFFIKA